LNEVDKYILHGKAKNRGGGGANGSQEKEQNLTLWKGEGEGGRILNVRILRAGRKINSTKNSNQLSSLIIWLFFFLYFKAKICRIYARS
jgi:hypothetical protein